MKKIIIPILISLFAFNVSAQVSTNDNFQTKTTINKTCDLSVLDVNLGIIDQSNFIQNKDNINGYLDINVRCSKGTIFYFAIPKDSGGPTSYWTKLPHINNLDNIWIYISCSSFVNGSGNCINGAPTLTDNYQSSWTSRVASGKNDLWKYSVIIKHTHLFTPGIYKRVLPLTLTY